MITRMFAGIAGKNYLTAEKAEAVFLKAIAPYDEDGTEHFRYLIATEAGRFFPVFLPSSEQIQIAINLAQRNGIACARG